MTWAEELKKKYTELLNPFKQSLSNSINDNQGWFQQGKFTPLKAVTNNWNPSNPVSQGLVGAQDFFQNNKPISIPIASSGPLKNTNVQFSMDKPFPTIQSNPNQGVLSSVGKFAANIPSSIYNGLTSPVAHFGQDIGQMMADNNKKLLSNTPSELNYGNAKSGVTRLLMQGVGTANPQFSKNVGVKYGAKEVIGNAADPAEFALNYLLLGKVPEAKALTKEVVDMAAKGGLKEGFLRAIGEGSKWGAGFGTLSGLQENRQTEDNTQYALSLAKDIGISTIIGGALGGLIGILPSLFGAYKGAMMEKNPKMTELEATTKTKIQLKNALGQWTGKFMEYPGVTESEAQILKRIDSTPIGQLTKADMQKAMELGSKVRWNDRIQPGQGIKEIGNVERISRPKVSTPEVGGIEALKQEAKNYKSAEEFVNKNDPVKYERTHIFRAEKGPEYGYEEYGPKMLALNLSANDLVKGKGITREYTLNALKDAYENGASQIQPSLGAWTKDGKGFMDTLVRDGWVRKSPNGTYFTTEKIKSWETKSTLTDIWNKSQSPIKTGGVGGNGFIDQSGRLIPVDQHNEAAFKLFKTAGNKEEALTELMTRGNIRAVVKPNEVNFEVIGKPTNSQLNVMMNQSQGKKIYFDLTDTKGNLVESKSFNNPADFLGYLQSKFSQPTIKIKPSEIKVPKITKSEVMPWEEPSYLASNKPTIQSKTDLNKIRKLVEAQTSPKVASVNSIPPKEVTKIQKIAPEKVNLLDYFRTPDRVMQKIGLGKEAETLKTSYNNYLDQLPKEINKITNWYDQVKSDPTSSKRLFQYLDGQPVKLTPNETKIAGEMKSYLSDWADKLDLPPEQRVTNYITHIFEKDFIKKDFDEDLAKIISERVPGSVYDPFTQERLGKAGYIEDVFKALDAYTKRAVRKVNMDPALELISQKSNSLPLESWNYVKSYIDRVNLRPTDIDTMIDNLVKQSPVGYKLGQRPVAAVSKPLRQWVYRGTLGGNVGSAVRNLTQGVNTYAKLGEKWTAKGYLDAFKSILTKGNELDAVGVLRDTNIQDRQLSAVKGIMEKADKGLFSLFQFAEKINRGSAYFGAKAKALSQGLSEQEAIQAGIKMARDTQFTFGSVDTPLVMSSDIVKTLGQFQSFNLKQTEFLTEMIKKKEFAGAIRWLGANLVIMATVGKLIGFDFKDIIPFSGVVTGDSKLGETPPIKMTKDIYGAVMNVPDKYGKVGESGLKGTLERLSDVAYKDLPAFIPGGVQAKKTIEGIQAVKQEGSYSKAGNLQYRITPSTENYIKAGLFGKSNLPQAQDRWSGTDRTLTEKQTSEYKASTDKQKYYDKTLKNQELSSNLKGSGYYTSADAPKNGLEKAIVFGKSVITNPKQVLMAVVNGNPIRKVENGYVVLERRQGLGQIDVGNKGAQVDHIVPLEFEGLNPKKSADEIIAETKGMSFDERNAYLKQYNLEVLPTAQHEIKTQVQNYLSNELKAKKITKKEASQRILNWRDETKNLPTSIQEKLVKDVVAAEPENKTYTITNEETGKDTTIDLTFPQLSKTTGYEEVDKENKTKYTSALTKLKSNAGKLYDAGQIKLEEYNNILTKVAEAKKAIKTTKAKKPKKVKIPKIKVVKIKMPKLKKIKIKKPKKVKVYKLPRVKLIKLKK